MKSEFETIEFTALDGFKCNLKHYLSPNPSKGPILLVHGAGVRADIFCPPNEQNIVEMLADDGYDVWLENWRASIDLPPTEWDLDVVARNDHPAAVQKVLELTGSKNLKALIHCQGSTSFMISVALGLVPQVTTIVSNAVSLHPKVPGFSRFKLNVLVPIVHQLFDFLNPQWAKEAPDFKTKLMKAVVKMTHWEKDTDVGKFVSFTYGSGMPALWELENLDKRTMTWIEDEFAAVPLSFFNHIRFCISKGVILPNDKKAVKNYAVDKLPGSPRIILFGGVKNKCFLADSQQATFAYLEAKNPGKHKLYLLDEYSHLDVFLGKNSHKDIFPIMINELNQN
ncbi:hypothetical protein Oweho_0733 [Owenweeksia hongkongensis DSM 17368]|uniref:Uncharacterized protein n=1 Tax=Owenweeksia hongkongensis (strain DSM 17368 / CIP 108786 / JCM 12287 / NRRL B-23963 / UST20020801) TaxID=926562 RepID=G8R1K7_OWEHD|nr:hypothetical protein [Owenweeksia hongkongensis]AEV31746.1 hypothetical protein Oweho_0733 [Owenweeksia hongkongensis DSM 17368]